MSQITVIFKAITSQFQAGVAKASGAIKGFSVAAAGAAAAIAATLSIALAKLALNLEDAGAASLRAKASLDALSSGKAAEFIESIQDAARGGVSEIDALATANRILLTGLVETAEEAGQLTEIAIGLGRAMGIEAAQALDIASMALARQSKLRADDLAILMDMQKVQRDANALMREDAALTEESARHLAFRNQFLEQGAEKLALMGGLQEDAANSGEVLDAAIADLKAVYGELIAEALEPVNRLLADNIRLVVETRQANRDQKEALAEASETVEEYAQAMFEAGQISEDFNDAIQAGGDTSVFAASVLAEFTEEYERLRAATLEADRVAQAHIQTQNRLAAATEETADSVQRLSNRVGKLDLELKEIDSTGADVSGIFEGLGSQLESAATSATAALQGGFSLAGADEGSGLSEEDLKRAFYAAVKQQTADPAIILQVGRALGLLTPDEEALITEMNRLAMLAAAGQLSDAELALVGVGLAGADAGALGGIAAGWVGAGSGLAGPGGGGGGGPGAPPVLGGGGTALDKLGAMGTPVQRVEVRINGDSWLQAFLDEIAQETEDAINGVGATVGPPQQGSLSGTVGASGRAK